MKRFNTTGKMIAAQHYMVPIDRQVNAAARLVEDGMYFCINRGRQYGKTTTLAFLKEHLEKQGYVVFSISFEGLADDSYKSLGTLIYESLCLMALPLRWIGIPNLIGDSSLQLVKTVDKGKREIGVVEFRDLIGMFCTRNKVVLIIDEVDQAGNYPPFIQFLSLLRNMYLSRDQIPTFHSVILAGVYDIKNLKLKLRPEELHRYNSPWNIAAPFDTDMSLHADGIAEMLTEYKHDHQIDFDEHTVAQMIYDYTSGYPFLVSRLCQIIDEKELVWDKQGLLEATQAILMERNTLFDDMVKKVEQYPQLRALLKDILFSGAKRTFSTDEKYIQLASMFNFVKNQNGAVVVNSRLMEIRLYNLFIGEEESSAIYNKGQIDKNQFIHDGRLDMRHVLERFAVHFNEIYRPEKDDKFVEEQGRKIFLIYLRPIINGVGNYYCEAQTRDLTRTDVVVDYRGQQFVVELKIWRGNSYNEREEQQLAGYLDFFHQQTGYMVSFSFNKDKQPGIHDVVVGDKMICEVIV